MAKINKRYIDAQTFDDFKCNQDKLIQVLNHNMTILKTDVSWLKKLNGYQVGILTAILAAVIGSALL